MLALTYFKSALVGIGTALLAVVVVVLAMLRFWLSEGSGAVSISVSSWQILDAAVLGFAAGFWLTLRRTRTHRA